MTPTLHRRQSGFSLIELMIAVVLGLLLVAAAGTIFQGTARSYREDERLIRAQDEAVFALAALASDIEMAGFWTTILNPMSITLDATLTSDPGCGPAGVPGWIYTERDRPFQGVDNATTATANARFPCISTGEFRAGTDVISIKRLASTPMTAAPTLTDGPGPYLVSNGITGVLFLGATPTTAITGTTRHWRYTPSIYYIRNYSRAAGDGIPALCRKVLEGSTVTTLAFQSSSGGCLAEGIEDLQVEYGIDSDGNGSPDRFLSAPSDTQFRQVAAVRVWLLARAVEPLTGYTNAKTYRLGNAEVRTPNDRYYRRVVSMTLAVRNPAALRVLHGT